MMNRHKHKMDGTAQSKMRKDLGETKHKGRIKSFMSVMTELICTKLAP